MRLLLIIVLLAGSRVFSSAQSFQVAGVMTQDKHAISPLFLQQQGNGNYKVARPPGLRMRNVGRTLTILGGAMLIGGVAVLSSADKETHYTYSGGYIYEEYDYKYPLGVLMIMGGGGMTVPGIIFWTKGAKKYNRYLEREAAASLSLKGPALSINYHF